MGTTGRRERNSYPLRGRIRRATRRSNHLKPVWSRPAKRSNALTTPILVTQCTPTRLGLPLAEQYHKPFECGKAELEHPLTGGSTATVVVAGPHKFIGWTILPAMLSHRTMMKLYVAWPSPDGRHISTYTLRPARRALSAADCQRQIPIKLARGHCGRWGRRSSPVPSVRLTE